MCSAKIHSKVRLHTSRSKRIQKIYVLEYTLLFSEHDTLLIDEANAINGYIMV